ncbi:hypothetical protein PTKIN_Ptkin04bG0024300 [Pterospermum kingtungense]
MKLKKKGKMYPSVSFSPFSSLASYRDPNSVFKLLPLAILSLASALSPPGSRGLGLHDNKVHYFHHKPIYSDHPTTTTSQEQCGCFECFTRLWHDVIVHPTGTLFFKQLKPFEDHLMQKEVLSKKQYCKAGSRKKDKVTTLSCICDESNVVSDSEMLVVENKGGCEQVGEENVGVEEVTVVAVATGISHKGLARKVLPDVVGWFNSRLRSLWGPSI